MTTMYGPSGGYGGDGGNTPNPHARVRFDVITEALSLIVAEMWTWVLIILVYMLITWGFGQIMNILFAAMGMEPRIVPGSPYPEYNAPAIVGTIIRIFLGTCFGAYFSAGLYQTALKQIRGGKIGIGDLFSGGPFTLPVLGATLLFQLATTIGFVLFIIPCFIVASGFSLALPIVADGRAGAVEAMRLSWLALKNQWLTMFGVLFCTGLLMIAGLAACGVGMLFTFPLSVIVPSLVYRDFYGALKEPELTIQMPLPPQETMSSPSQFDV